MIEIICIDPLSHPATLAMLFVKKKRPLACQMLCTYLHCCKNSFSFC